MGALPITVPAKIKNGRLVLLPRAKRFSIPDGEVTLTVHPSNSASKDGLTYKEIIAHPAFGIWKDRKDATDTIKFAAKLRKKLEKELFGGRDSR